MLDWRSSTWGEEIVLEYGKALRDYSNGLGKYRVYGSNGPIGWTDSKLADGPGVILGRKGAYRGVEFAREPFFVIDTAYYVVPKSALDFRWLYYAIKYHKLGEIDDGSPIPSTTRAAVYVRELDVPPLSTQRAIAHILGTLDDKIELNRRMNATLEAMARALFQSWFVDFDPVRAKMDGRKPAGMDAETAALFPDSFVESELGLIPEGWKFFSVEDLTIKVTKGDTPRSDAIAGCPSNERQIPMLRVNAITDEGEVLMDKAEYIPESIHLGKSKRSILEENDILYTNAGTIGRVAIVQHGMLPANTNQAMAIVRPDTSRIPAHLLYMFLRHPSFQEVLHQDIVHAVQANLALGKISAARVPCPSFTTMSALTKPISSALKCVFENRKQSGTLATLRDTLLPKLLSGELSVKHAEKLVGTAT